LKTSDFRFQDARAARRAQVRGIAPPETETIMTLTRHIAAALLAAAALTQPAAAEPATAEPAGMRSFAIEMPHHGRAAQAALWYPPAPGGEAGVFAGNQVFRGVPVMQDAPLAEGRRPLVLLSHGLGGGVQSVSWLGAGLAGRGAIVLAVNHLNSTWSAFDMREGVRHWTRVQDLSRALDVLLADEALAAHVDPDRIMAAGFSFGGWTALSMGGARANHAGLLETCRRFGAGMSLCDGLLSDALNLEGVDPDAWNADYRDARVSRVAAIDPGFVWGLSEADVAALEAPVTLIGLGAGDDRLLAADFDASGLAERLQGARVERLFPATHFTAMPLCTTEGAAILRAERDDPVCDDPAGADRAAAHARIIAIIAEELGL
jgi:predicted dienelactone hydrolase